MTLIVGAGALLLLHQLPISVVVACATQLQILLLHRVGRYLLDGQPVQRLLSEEREKQQQKVTLSGKLRISFFFQQTKKQLRRRRIFHRLWVAAALIPLFAGDFLRFGAPAHWHQSQVV